jgi:hypothetical protein
MSENRAVSRSRVVALYLLSWIGVPLLFAAVDETLNGIFLRSEHLPSFLSGDAAFWVIFIACLVAGAICLVKAHFAHRIARILVPLVYVALMPVILMIVNLVLACHHGDCI